MITANTMVTALATATGILLLSKPNTSQQKVPGAKREYINNDMPDVSFVRIVFNACGRKDMVVKERCYKTYNCDHIHNRKINKYSHYSSNRNERKVTKCY